MSKCTLQYVAGISGSVSLGDTIHRDGPFTIVRIVGPRKKHLLQKAGQRWRCRGLLRVWFKGWAKWIMMHRAKHRKRGSYRIDRNFPAKKW